MEVNETITILCVCTAGKDRSRALAKHLRSKGYNAIHRGISSWHAVGRRVDLPSIRKANLILCAEPVHEAYINGFMTGLEIGSGQAASSQENAITGPWPPIRCLQMGGWLDQKRWGEICKSAERIALKIRGTIIIEKMKGESK